MQGLKLTSMASMFRQLILLPGMLLNNSIGGTKIFLKAAASREQTYAIPSVRGEGFRGVSKPKKKGRTLPFWPYVLSKWDGVGGLKFASK